MNNSSIDQRIMKYKTEMQDLKKIATSRVAEFESNIEEYQRLLVLDKIFNLNINFQFKRMRKL